MRRTTAILLLTGCATAKVPTTPAGQSVTVAKSDPPSHCSEVGPLRAVHGNADCGIGNRGSYEGAYAVLRNKAAAKGANYVRIDDQIPAGTNKSNGECIDLRYVIHGVAFYCGQAPQASQKPASQADSEHRCISDEEYDALTARLNGMKQRGRISNREYDESIREAKDSRCSQPLEESGDGADADTGEPEAFFEEEAAPNEDDESTTKQESTRSVEERLAELERLRKKGLISDVEYEAKRKEILESL